MASTNKTTNYELSQYVASDKPTYLVDYNGDMSKIDTAIYNAKSEADTNSTSIGTLANLTTDSKSDLVGAINEIDDHCDTAIQDIGTMDLTIQQNTADIGTLAYLHTVDKSNLVDAVNEVNDFAIGVGDKIDELTDYFTLVDFQAYTTFNTAFGSTGTASGRINVARNTDGTLCKIYGYLQIVGATQYQGNTYRIAVDTGLRPTEDITIAGVLVPTDTFAYSPTITIKTTGMIEFNITPNSANFDLYSTACLIFVSDFGDTNQ